MILQNVWIRLIYAIFLTGNEDSRLISFHHELWHASVGAMIAHDEFGIADADVLNAIRFHTTGRANMSMLEKLDLCRRYD